MCRGRKADRTFRTLAVLLVSLAGCAAPSVLDPSARFSADSDKALVVVGSSIFWADDFRDPDQSLTQHWQAFDPRTLHLVPDGQSFTSLTRAAVRMKIADPLPPAQVLLVEPGSYALVAAGSGTSKTFHVPVREQYRNRWGFIRVKGPYLDPLAYIEPEAQLAEGKNLLFAVEAGQIVYLGHFVYARHSRYLSGFDQARRVIDEAAARAALAAYPGISGTMVTLDPAKPPQQVLR
jgi:hypothetical protein